MAKCFRIVSFCFLSILVIKYIVTKRKVNSNIIFICKINIYFDFDYFDLPKIGVGWACITKIKLSLQKKTINPQKNKS